MEGRDAQTLLWESDHHMVQIKNFLLLAFI